MATEETNSSRKHAYTDAGIPQLPEPTYAERVRTLVSLSTIATLSTVSPKALGIPVWFSHALCDRRDRAAHFSDQQYGDAYSEHSD